MRQALGVETGHSLGKVAGELARTQVEGVSVSFACRYLSTQHSEHDLGAAELEQLEAAGIKLVSCYENGNPTRVEYFTREQGHHDGELAVELALKLGQPSESAIYFAIDFDPYREFEFAAVDAYFEGVVEGANEATQAGGESAPEYAIGVYGSRTVLERVVRKHAEFGWQSFAPGWAGGTNGHLSPFANLHTCAFRQHVAGVEVEFVEVPDGAPEEFGAWDRVIR